MLLRWLDVTDQCAKCLRVVLRHLAYGGVFMEYALSKSKYCKGMQCPKILWLDDNKPELYYHNLEGIHNGSEASVAFADMINHTPEEIKTIRTNLLKYCALDTYAMVKVLRKLKEVADRTFRYEI